MGEVDIARNPAIARQIRVVEDVVVEAVAGEDVAVVVRGKDRPVVSQPLGAKHEDTVVAELVVLDDRERLESLAQADTVGQDAAAEAFELFDRANDAVALKLVQLLPDGSG